MWRVYHFSDRPLANDMGHITNFFSPSFFFICMALMNEEVIGEDIEGYTAEVHLEQAGRFVAAISREAFVTPTKFGARSNGQY